MTSTLTSPSMTAAQIGSKLYRLSAILYAASIIGHTKHGFDKVYPAIDAIPARKEHEVGKGAAIGGWDYINASLLVAALLNWDWARSLRPRTLEDKLVIYTLSVAGALWSIRFVKVKTYLALVPLFIAPSCSLAASVLKP